MANHPGFAAVEIGKAVECLRKAKELAGDHPLAKNIEQPLEVVEGLYRGVYALLSDDE